MLNLFKKKQYVTVPSGKTEQKTVNEIVESKNSIPDGLWTKCDGCGKIILKSDLENNLMKCPNCSKYFRIAARQRIDLVIDNNTFKEYDRDMMSLNPLDYPEYEIKLKKLNKETGLNEAVVTGEGLINGEKCVIAAMDSNFLMGSMGSVVGEKITRAIERATEQKIPVIIFTASGGARMQEGIFSLMQMAKTSAAIKRHSDEGLLYVSVLTDPTTGGVTASFAMLGDIILAEPGALIGFAGPRVIEQTIKQKLPEGFQRAEFLLEHGFLDAIVKREELKKTLYQILLMHRR
ncbi:Acetyl-coenzyme A carboxylase carboxyl transferase subunit beta [Caloramator mitchellensis]|uniref:Acetyl-coenzyme A carboxylase carboxyl transferase subunit beta n=1 Tax=Caloramator mitchellensis TaxID=908809 RepID=A0A0R3JWG6_CALMK|nr:acetyl-CoA carboxylase, carboxyltransferase subunit beta [Caloramator mitchellensis]KRQ87873.1 Acetyl-coenzyme A carboxylase carboxyl transferase subunit beta [Caloramator mitchellensis]